MRGTKMKNTLLLLFIFLSFYKGMPQKQDSIPTLKTNLFLNKKQFIAPVTLIDSGFLLLNTAANKNFQKDANDFFGSGFNTRADDFLFFVPAVQICFGRNIGFKPKTDFKQQVMNIFIASVISVSVSEILKRSFKEERPDKSNALSFPSGHTTIAFTNAALLYNDYKDSNIWYASSGFLFATATGLLRVANNKHYVSDVLTGTGIGLATGIIISHWNPLKSVSFLNSKKATAFVYPQIGNQIGMGAVISLN
jgi:membrane-associated phospholipid phosphatase